VSGAKGRARAASDAEEWRLDVAAREKEYRENLLVNVVRIFTDDKLPMKSNTNFFEFD